MMCPNYEDLLVGYHSLEREEQAWVDAHLRLCSRCSDCFVFLSQMDQSLSALEGMRVPRDFRRSLGKRLNLQTKPTYVPEILDLSVGLGVIFLTGLALRHAVTEAYLVPTVVLLVFGLSICVGLKVYGELGT